MRTLALTVLLAIGAGVSTEAWAVSKEELKAEKEDYKAAKARWKDVSKLAEKWAKANEKDKDTSEIDAELKAFYREDIALIRAAGIEVKPGTDETGGDAATPAPEGGATPDAAAPAEEPKEKLEELRDIVVPLRDGEVKGKEKAKALEKYARILEDRYMRKLNQYEKDKAES